jgi:hypothetical protein
MLLPSTRVRRAFAAGICVAGLVSVATFVAATGFAAPARAPRCRTSGLVVWLDTRGGGAAGSVYYKLHLTNLSGHACTLFGYPGVSAVDLRGHQLGRAASRNNAISSRLVTLANGATATSVLQITDVYNFPRSACRPTTAAGLRVYPPNQTAAKIVPFPFAACSRTGPAYLSTEAVKKA